MQKRIDLTEGDILQTLTRLALPIMGSSFIQMAYNLFDMKFVGSISYQAVTAVGTASFFLMISQSLIMLFRVGAEVHVAQSLGKGEMEKASVYATTSLKLGLFLSIVYSLVGFIFRREFINFFQIKDVAVVSMGIDYLSIIVISLPLMFMNYLLIGILNAGGYSNVPFLANAAGVLVKVSTSWALINGAFGLPAMGVKGSALSTILAQLLTFVILVKFQRGVSDEYLRFKWRTPIRGDIVKQILIVGGPSAINSLFFSLTSTFIGRIVSNASVMAASVQRIGAQIESVSWMTSSGFASALSAVTGQNYGAGKYKRVVEGFVKGTLMVAGIGVFATALLMLLPRQLFSLFISQPEEVVTMGINYLVILGISQLFQSFEISTEGAFAGLGLTQIPSVISILFTTLRIPAALFLMNTSLGINGIWWAISLSTVFKGIIGIFFFYWVVIRRLNQGLPLHKTNRAY